MTRDEAMTPEEARERFSEALEGELVPEEQRRFEAALARDPGLQAEYEAFTATVRSTRALGAARPRADLAPVVQETLRRRSRGRYYRDRFSRRTPRQTLVPLLVLGGVLALVVAAWFLV
ncbi:MAG: anti-sigma factor family protein [Myxococcota bacterium]